MTREPIVSVVMAAYNEESFVTRAVSSILGQSLRELELIVVDDGSTDGTAAALKSISDPRLRLVQQANQGLERSLNRGIALARGQYVARMDADDVSREDRLALQVEFLTQHSDVGIVGSFCRLICEDSGQERHFSVPVTDDGIRRHMLSENPFVHSSVVMRTTVLNKSGLYDPAYRWGDYELWWRVLLHCNGANIPVELVTRFHRQSSTYRVKKSYHYIEKLRVQLRAAKHADTSSRIYPQIAMSGCAFLVHNLVEAFRDWSGRVRS